MDLELLQWGDGFVHITFWNNESGEDRTFVIYADGSATEVFTTFNENGNEVERRVPVNLGAVLYEMCPKVSQKPPKRGRPPAPPAPQGNDDKE